MAKILIIEDNLANTKLTQLLLERGGHTCLAARDAETGMSMAALERPDLILIDIQLPGMDGLTAASILKHNPVTAAIPVIALTSMGRAQDEHKLKEAGCDGWVATPVRYQELHRAIYEVLARGATVATEGGEGPLACILVADNVAHDRELLMRMLEGEGYKALGASNAEDALQLVESDPPDLILLGAAIAGHNGHHIARGLKSDPVTAGIPVVMLTSRDDGADRLNGLMAGAEDFLIKPVDPTELWLRVRNLLRLKEYNDFLQAQGGLLEMQVQKRTAELQRFRAAMDTAAEAIMLIDPETGRFVEVNTTACTMLGYTREELFSLGPEQLGGGVLEHLEMARDGDGQHDEGSMSENTLRRRDGADFQVEMHQHIQYSDDGRVGVVVMRDITERKEAEARLHHMAHHDALTGLANRAFFLSNLEKTMALATANREQVAVMFVDFDHFKNINDTLGHDMGDELLIQMGDRLLECLRSRDMVGRLGGDEFAIAMVTKNGQHGAALTASKIQKALSTPFNLNGHDVIVTASIGVALYPQDASAPEDLLKYADTAMYRAKLAGRDGFKFFTVQMNEEVSARIELEAALRQAIDNHEFVLHYQPKVEISSGKIVGLEALLRWERPGHGTVMPTSFIETLEETGLIRRVGNWVIGEACAQIQRWQQSGAGPVQVSVNVSPRQFAEDDLELEIVKGMHEFGVSPDLLELELTESTMMANSERTIMTLQRLKELGVQISIDDFGTGYSSLSYLQRFPVDKLKIDISFVRELTLERDGTIALAIIQLAKSLNMDVIAEGVETDGQFAYLRRHHCDQIQGNYLSEAQPALALDTILRDRDRSALLAAHEAAH